MAINFTWDIHKGIFYFWFLLKYDNSIFYNVMIFNVPGNSSVQFSPLVATTFFKTHKSLIKQNIDSLYFFDVPIKTHGEKLATESAIMAFEV